jgi:hypothetical protein
LPGGADYLPDTSVVHMAAAWNKPLIAVYKDVLLNNRLWARAMTTPGRSLLNAGRSISIASWWIEL